jgi:hypothetical protein
MVVALNELPVHKLYTAATQRVEVPAVESGELEQLVLPLVESVDAKLAKRLCGQMMVVAYYYVKTIEEEGKRRRERRLLCQKDGAFFAKDRYSALGNWMREPDVPDIERRILSKINRMRREAA